MVPADRGYHKIVAHYEDCLARLVTGLEGRKAGNSQLDRERFSGESADPRQSMAADELAIEPIPDVEPAQGIGDLLDREPSEGRPRVAPMV